MNARTGRISWGFVGRMAWRDSRASRRRLVLFTACIAVGIAALVALGSFGRSLERAVAQQAKMLLGADLSVGSRVRFTEEQERLLTSLGGEQAREITFTSMIVFPGNGGTRLVQVRALEGGFPFYGKLETEPEGAEAGFRGGAGVLVEESMLLQFGVAVGDEVRIGRWTTRVAGSLRRVPGETVAFATLAPRVYLPMSALERTGLLREGSLARYRVLFRMPEGWDATKWVKENQGGLDALRLSVSTVAQRQEDLGEAMRNLDHFLNLVGFVALLLGGVGIASAIQVHVQKKVPTVAVLRCLGCGVWEAFWIYLVQGMALGAVGVVGGVVAGVAIQKVVPWVMADFVAVEIATGVSWGAVGEAAAVGFGMAVAFTLLPLAAIRRVSPLEVLRVAYEAGRRWDGFRWMT